MQVLFVASLATSASKRPLAPTRGDGAKRMRPRSVVDRKRLLTEDKTKKIPTPNPSKEGSNIPSPSLEGIKGRVTYH